MTNSNQINSSDKFSLTYTIFTNNAHVNSGQPNIVIFDVKHEDTPISNKEVNIILQDDLTFTTPLITDANGQCILLVTSENVGEFVGLAILDNEPSISTAFTLTFTEKVTIDYPVVISEKSSYFDTSYHGIHHFLADVSIESNHRYTIELSRSPENIIICTSSNPDHVAHGTPASCSGSRPRGFESFSEDGLDVMALFNGNGSNMFGRYTYSFAENGYTIVKVTDYGPINLDGLELEN